MFVELTPEQQEAVDVDGARVVVEGSAGTGKTTSLIRRYVRLAGRHPASRLLVVTRTRLAAQHFTAAVLPHLRGGFDGLPIATAYGLAFDLVSRSGRPLKLLSRPEQRAVVRRLLASE